MVGVDACLLRARVTGRSHPLRAGGGDPSIALGLHSWMPRCQTRMDGPQRPRGHSVPRVKFDIAGVDPGKTVFFDRGVAGVSTFSSAPVAAIAGAATAATRR